MLIISKLSLLPPALGRSQVFHPVGKNRKIMILRVDTNDARKRPPPPAHVAPDRTHCSLISQPQTIFGGLLGNRLGQFLNSPRSKPAKRSNNYDSFVDLPYASATIMKSRAKSINLNYFDRQVHLEELLPASKRDLLSARQRSSLPLDMVDLHILKHELKR